MNVTYRARLLRCGVLVAHEEHRRHASGQRLRPERKVRLRGIRFTTAATTVCCWVGRRDGHALPTLSHEHAAVLDRELLVVAPGVATRHLHGAARVLRADVDAPAWTAMDGRLRKCTARARRKFLCAEPTDGQFATSTMTYTTVKDKTRLSSRFGDLASQVAT